VVALVVDGLLILQELVDQAVVQQVPLLLLVVVMVEQVILLLLTHLKDKTVET
jgi:hypothetical protein